MTLAETYALSCGVPLDRPEIVEAFYPLEHPIDKTILLHAFATARVNEQGQTVSDSPAKLYEHFDEVVALLKPIVEPVGYRFCQIGAPGEPNLLGIPSLVGKTTVHQCAFLVKRAALLIGNDSMWAHVAGEANRPQVHCLGSTSKPHYPYWHDGKAAFFLESHRRGGKPSYAAAENPKTINWIPPEQVAIAALKALGLPFESITRQSLFIGEAYKQEIVEMVPDTILAPTIQLPGPLAIRMDYAKDWTDAENKLLSNARLRKCIIVTNREINLNLLTQIKPNITAIRVEVDTIDPKWIKGVSKLGIPVAFFAMEKDPETLRRLRLSLYQQGCLFDQYQVTTKDDFYKGAEVYLNKPLDKGTNLDTIRFKTRKFLLASNKVYLSKAHWLAGRPTPSTDQNSDSIIDSHDFWEDLPHLYLYHNE